MQTQRLCECFIWFEWHIETIPFCLSLNTYVFLKSLELQEVSNMELPFHGMEFCYNISFILFVFCSTTESMISVMSMRVINKEAIKHSVYGKLCIIKNMFSFCNMITTNHYLYAIINHLLKFIYIWSIICSGSKHI